VSFLTASSVFAYFMPYLMSFNTRQYGAGTRKFQS
jgi:hypothetical protein